MKDKRYAIASILASGLALILTWLLAGAPVPSAQAAPQNPTASVSYVDADATGTNNGSSWPDAYTNLQDALAAASNGDEIWVAEGVYTPGITRTTTFQLKDDVALYGGFVATETLRTQRDWETHVTVLSGDLDRNDTTDANGVVTDTANIVGDNAYHVVTGRGVTETGKLDGFTITAGKADDYYYSHYRGGGLVNVGGSPTLTNVTFSGNSAYGGGGMYNYDHSNPMLTNVTFSGNSAYDGGGGMYNNSSSPTLTNVTFSGNSSARGGGMYNYNSSPTLTDVTFSSNTADERGGGMYSRGGSPMLTNVTFSGNSAYDGGGMHNWVGSSPTLTNVTFSSNTATRYGGGMVNYDHSNPMLTNVTFRGNSAYYGGGVYNDGSNPRLANVTFRGNSAYYGGGIYNTYSSPRLANVTLSGNTATWSGDGMYNYSSSPTLANCILWGNTASHKRQIYNAGSVSKPTISYSLVQGSGGSGARWNTILGHDGGGNVDADPRFLRPPSPGDGDWSTPADNDYGDLRLHHDSPAVDAGDNSAVPLGVTTDLGGNPRFLDVAAAPDAGAGSPPIVDMGAYEHAATDLHIVKSVIPPTPLLPGEPITYVLSFANGGSTVVAGAIITDAVPGCVVDTSVISAGAAITDTSASQPYVWQVNALAPGERGIITITGQISPALTGPHTFTNTTTIATTSVDTNTINNVSSVQTHVTGVIYVDRDAVGAGDGSSWADAYTHLQDGLATSRPGDEIWVAEGVYTPGITRTATFQLKSGVALYGGFVATETLCTQRDWEAHVTVLSGDLDGNDVTDANGVVTSTTNITGTNAYHVVTGSGTDSTAILNGFSITAGKADGSYPHHSGGGMHSNDNSNPTLANVTFSSNTATRYGGGMYNEYSSPTLTNVTFSGNSSTRGGGMCNYSSSPPLTNVTFSGNTADERGGGMYNWDSDTTLTNITFSGSELPTSKEGGLLVSARRPEWATPTQVLHSLHQR